MTKSRGIRPARVRLTTLEELPARILELLEIAPRTNDALEKLTGWSIHTLRKHLAKLRDEQFIYARGVSVNKGGIQQCWHLGDEPPYEVTARSLPKQPGGCEMRQRVVQQYDIHKFRDPMDVALFGPAHKEAA